MCRNRSFWVFHRRIVILHEAENLGKYEVEKGSESCYNIVEFINLQMGSGKTYEKRINHSKIFV